MSDTETRILISYTVSLLTLAFIGIILLGIFVTPWILLTLIVMVVPYPLVIKQAIEDW